MTPLAIALALLAAPPPQTPPAPRPSPEMRRVFEAFLGDWDVVESFQVSARHRGESRRGGAIFREGAGFSLVEEYRSNGSAGALRFLGVLWWDAPAGVYRFLTCVNEEGCEVRGTARWEGTALVNSWVEKSGGKKTSYRDAFTDIGKDAFTLVSEGRSDGEVVWRVVTRYTRRERAAR